MTFRLLWAVLTTLLAGAWLWLRSRRPDRTHAADPDRVTVALRAGVLLLCLFWSVQWGLLALARLAYPFELEWTGGAMLDHCRRLLENRPLYPAPGADWIPFPHPPLYFWLGAFLMNLTGNISFAPLRLISCLATLGSARLLYVWTRRLVNTGVPPLHSIDPFYVRERDEALRQRNVGRMSGALAVGLFLAAYGLAGAWYDLEKPDMLFLFLTLAGAYLLEYAAPKDRSIPLELACAGGAGLLFVLAFLTDVRAILFAVGGVIALLWRRAWTQAVFFVLVASVCGVEATLGLNDAARGWFFYYVFRVPFASGWHPTLLPALLRELILLAPILVTMALVLVVGRRTLTALPEPILPESPPAEPVSYAVVLAMLIMSWVVSGVGALAWGAGAHALIPALALFSLTTGAVIGRWERDHPRLRAPLYGLALAQLLTLAYRPDTKLPSPANGAFGRRYAQVVQALETEGTVWSLDHGGFTKHSHPHRQAVEAILATEGRLPSSLLAALRPHRIAVILTDAPPHAGSLLDDELLRDYALAENPAIGGPWVVIGPRTPQPDQSIWVLRPRPSRIPPTSTPIRLKP